MSKLNAGSLLMEIYDLSEVARSLSESERKMLNVIRKYPGISRYDLSLKMGMMLRESDLSMFKLAKKSLVHIVNENYIHPVI